MRLISMLNQDEKWTDAHGAVHRIVDMDERYRTNVEAFLMRRADGFKQSCSMEMVAMPMPQGEIACDEIEIVIDREMSEMFADPEGWLCEKPLLKALRSGCPQRIWMHRHQPHGCTACGMGKRGHKPWSPTHGLHDWEAPDDWLMKARMRARRAKKWGDWA